METFSLTCSNLGCEKPGTNRCSACKTAPYCGPICQTADWAHHKEKCPGHLRKIGIIHLTKAQGFERERNWPMLLHHANIAATKLKLLKDRPVELIDDALRIKYNVLSFTGRNREALECAKEWYCMYPSNHTHPPAIHASFAVIESCGRNKEYFDAAIYARTVWETITLSRDSHIPDNLRERFTARGAIELARALWQLAAHGDMPAEEQKKTGVEAIMLARRALEINIQLFGADSEDTAIFMGTLADILDYFHDNDDDEVTRLYEKAIAIHTRLQGSLSVNVGIGKFNLATLYYNRARRARAAHDLDRCIANLDLAILCNVEAAPIFRAINHVENANKAARNIIEIEGWLQQITAERAAAT